MTNLFELITSFGNWQVISGLALLTIIVMNGLRVRDRVFYVFISTILGGEGIVLLLKNLFQIPRPDTINGALMMAEGDYSFPSGHTFMAVAFYGFFAYFLSKPFDSAQGKHVDKKWLRYVLSASLLFLILTIAFSRWYLGYHALWEVVGSLLLGFLWLMTVQRYLLTGQKE